MNKQTIRDYIESCINQIEHELCDMRKYAAEHPPTLAVQAQNIARRAAELSCLAGRLQGTDD